MIVSVVKKFAPWIITCLALYFAFHNVEWDVLLDKITNADFSWLAIAFFLTISSYLMRGRRWQFFFPKPCIDFFAAVRVLILGFFMNNVLPARTGELVRAHMGAKVTKESGTLVLATIASERLADGLTLSLMFMAFALGVGKQEFSLNLFYVALLFASATVAVGLTLIFRERLFALAEKVHLRFDNRASNYTFSRVKIFIDGLIPLFSPTRLPIIALWSIIIWSVELGVYYCVALAYGTPLTLANSVLFLVAVNFSSLIPAAPGGLGVIEALTSAVLVSVGIDKEHALAMVISQHTIQYLVVGIPGATVMLTWKRALREIPDNQ